MKLFYKDPERGYINVLNVDNIDHIGYDGKTINLTKDSVTWYVPCSEAAYKQFIKGFKCDNPDFDIEAWEKARHL